MFDTVLTVESQIVPEVLNINWNSDQASLTLTRPRRECNGAWNLKGPELRKSGGLRAVHLAVRDYRRSLDAASSCLKTMKQ